ncbi:MAG: hypothetical protein ABI337_08855 [Nitrososphaera sp.]
MSIITVKIIGYTYPVMDTSEPAYAPLLDSGFGTKFYALILGKHVVCTYTTAACATQATTSGSTTT